MQQDVNKRIRNASLLLMASVIFSRVIGFFREWVLARTVGASAMTDVYYASFTIPDFLNYLMAAGALSISFIPLLSGYLAEGRTDFGKRFFRVLGTWMGLLLIVFIGIGEYHAENLGRWIAPGFNREQMALLSHLIRIILPAQFFFYWGGLAISVQQTHGKFLFSALAPIVYNALIILFGVLFHESLGVAGFSVGVLVGSILGQGLMQWWGVAQLGYSVLPSFRLDAEARAAFRQYLWLTLPIMLGFSLVATDEWISKYFASGLEGPAISWLSYARTEMRIPIAIIGQAAGIASFPYLSRLWSQKDFAGYGNTLLREIEKLWALAPLAAILLWNHALPLTHFIYGGGRFSIDDLHHTAEALRMLSLGVFFWTVQVLLSRGFYACRVNWLPSLIGSLLTIACFPLYQRLSAELSYRGLALAGSIAIAIYAQILALLLWRHLKKHGALGRFRSFLIFCASWAAVIGGMYVVSSMIAAHAGLYQGTQWTGLLEFVVASIVVGGGALLLLRTIFRRLTDGPLF